jgi:hypothetical protein
MDKSRTEDIMSALKRWWDWICSFLPWREIPLSELKEAELLEVYFQAGKNFAEAHMDLEFEEASDFQELLQKWILAEEEMLRRNLIVFPVLSFARAIYDREKGLQGLGEKYPPEVTPIPYARKYRKEYPRSLPQKHPCLRGIFVS